LAARLWRERLAETAVDVLAGVITGPGEVRLSDDGLGFADACRKALERTPELDAIAEILVLAHFDSVLAEAVDETLLTSMRNSCTPSDRLTAVDAARNAYAVSLVLGLLLMSRYPWARDPGLDEALRLRYLALSTDVTITKLPIADAPHMDVRPVLAADDPALDLLLNTTLETIAGKGFDATTVHEVCEGAGYTEGLAFRRYRTKMDLLIDATRRQEAYGWRANADFMRSIEDVHGLAVAEAIYVREALKPGRSIARVMTLEESRLSWHNLRLLTASIDELSAFRARLLTEPGWGEIETDADFFLNTAAPLGCLLLPRIVPEAFDLPWNAVTVPLFGALTDRTTRSEEPERLLR
jgi:AcrR family transcriptional regulator